MNIAQIVRTVPDWPIKGVMFRDITTVLQDPDAFRHVVDRFYDRYKGSGLTKVVAIDARGFLFGSVLAYKLGVGLIPVRKKGKLPYQTIRAEYSLEYGSDVVEMHEDAIVAGDHVLIVDDLIATGGTISAAIKLVEQLGGRVAECAFLIELPELRGRDKIKGYPIYTMLEFNGE